MGKRGGGATTSSSSGLLHTHTQLSLREEASGRKQSHNPKSILKLKHLQNLAQWAASVPSLGSFYGRRFAEFGEALGISPEHSLLACQRCETILQPGFNCSVRIEKNRSKKRRRCSKTNSPTQNNVVYNCHFCSHRNLKRGSPKGYIREMAPSKTKTFQKPKAENSTVEKCEDVEKTNENKVESYETTEPPSPSPSPVSNVTNSITDSAPAPLANTGAKLLDSNKRKRKKQGSKGSNDEYLVSSAPADAEKASGTSRKRKKSWTTLKEIAANEEHERNQRFKNFSIPFLL